MSNGKPDTCKTCPLYASTEGPVWGEGPLDAKQFYIGEAPGEEEGLHKRPFVGGAGRTLNGLCNHAGVRRSEVYVTNIVKCRPTAKGATKIINRAPTETEIRNCIHFLAKELAQVRPNVIVALGNVPLHTITDTKKGILSMRSVPIVGPRRRAQDDQDPNAGPERFKVVPTMHPAALMRQPQYWPAVVFDLARANVESAYPDIRRRSWKRVIHARLSDVGEALERRIRTPRLGGLTYYSHDLETTGLNSRTDTIRCIGLAAEPDEVFCFDWTSDVADFVRRLHADPTLLTVGQNSEAFDIPFQEAKGATFNGPTFDTMIGWHLLNSALPKDLAFIGASATDEVYWKDDSMYRSGEDALQLGCTKDVHATGRAFEDEYTEMQQLNQWDLYWNQIMPLQPILRRMSERGVKKDQRVAAGWHILLNRKADELEIKLKRGLGDASFNVDSPKQLIDLLYNRMGLPIQYNTDRETGTRPTVDANALDALSIVLQNSTDPHHQKIAPIFKLVRYIRTLRKWDSTFVMCPQDDKYFVHPKFGSAKASTGRLNSYDPNFQNWPVEVREIIVPDDKDHIIMSRDWSGIEWRIAMTLAGDEVGLDAIKAGRDPHSDSYSKAFGKAYEEVNKKERYEAKTINYGMLYGRSAESLAAGRVGHPESAIPVGNVTSYMNAFFATFHGYYSYRESIKEFVLKSQYYATAWGRRRWWFTRQQLPEAFNYPMQGNAAHMMYIALIQMEAQLPKGATLRASVHDECVVMCHKDVARLADECMRDIMEQKFNEIRDASRHPDIVDRYYPNGWFCDSDGTVGETWRATKPDSPPEYETERKLRAHLGLS